MKTRNNIVVLITLSVACTTATGQYPKDDSFRFPGSWYVAQGVTSPLDEMQKSLSVTNTEELVTKLSRLLPNVDKELADPFISERLHFVQFESSEPGLIIADFFATAFKTAGWKEGRNILDLEYTGCGGDWLRVFYRGTQQVLVHVCGRMERTEDETPDLLVTRTITFRFRGINPEELFGPDVVEDRSEHAPPAGRGEAPRP